MTPELSPDTRDWLQADVDDTYQRFLVARRRGSRPQRRGDRRDRRGPRLDRRAGRDARPRRRARRPAHRGGEGEGEGRHRRRRRRRALGLPAAEAARRADSRGAARRASRRTSRPHYPWSRRRFASVATWFDAITVDGHRARAVGLGRDSLSSRTSPRRRTAVAAWRRSSTSIARGPRRRRCSPTTASSRDLFPDTTTEIVARKGQRKTIESHYTALGREGVATFHFDYEPSGDVQLREGLRRPHLARAARRRDAHRAQAEDAGAHRARRSHQGAGARVHDPRSDAGPARPDGEGAAQAARREGRSGEDPRRATASSSTSSRTATARRSSSRAATRPRARTSARRSRRWSPPATAWCSGTTAGTATRTRPTIPTRTRSTSCSTISVACSTGARKGEPAVLAGFSFGGAAVAALRAASSRARARAGADRHGPRLQEPARRRRAGSRRSSASRRTSRRAGFAVVRREPRGRHRDRPPPRAARRAARGPRDREDVAARRRELRSPRLGPDPRLHRRARRRSRRPRWSWSASEDEAYLRAADVMAARLPNAQKVVIPARRPRRQHRRTRSPERRHPRVPAQPSESRARARRQPVSRVASRRRAARSIGRAQPRRRAGFPRNSGDGVARRRRRCPADAGPARRRRVGVRPALRPLVGSAAALSRTHGARRRLRGGTRAGDLSAPLSGARTLRAGRPLLDLALHDRDAPRAQRIAATAAPEPAPQHRPGGRRRQRAGARRRHARAPTTSPTRAASATAVEQALAQLPERQRIALWLSAVEGLSYAEVAASLETSEKSVKALVHRARCALAESIGGEER